MARHSHSTCGGLLGVLVVATLAATTPARADGLVGAALDLDLRERIRAFRETLRDMAGPSTETVSAGYADGSELFLESRSTGRSAPDLDELTDLPVPGMRDLVFEERWLLAGREEHVERAARHWLGRRLKGSDRRHAARHRPGARPSPRLAWNHGPVVGVRVGPVSARVSEDSWRLQWREVRSTRGGPWSTEVHVGERDGALQVGFTVGRTLLTAAAR